MIRGITGRFALAMIGCVMLLAIELAAATLGGPLPAPLPLFPSDNWWNVDVSAAPIDPASNNFITFINNGSTRRLHPDFGGEASPGSDQIYGFPYIVVDGTQAKRTVQFQYSDESDGVNHTTDQSFPFYPIPDEAITLPHWVESGEPGNVDLRSSSHRPCHQRVRVPGVASRGIDDRRAADGRPPSAQGERGHLVVSSGDSEDFSRHEALRPDRRR
jgi:hypothetical protein